MPANRILGSGKTHGVSFWPLLNSPCWWWLLSSLFLTRTSCHKITHKNGYHRAWPGWAVPVSVLPLTASRGTRVAALRSHVLSRTQAAEYTEPSPCPPQPTPRLPSAPKAEPAVIPGSVRADSQALHGVPIAGWPGHEAPGS